MPRENRKYFSLAVNEKTADLNIYGDICSWPWLESDVSAYNLSKQLDELTDVDTINVNINSYGGEVAEGLAIYNALKRHPAKVVTRCDGMACSIASVIFMAGEERIMYDTTMLMIHHAWTRATGNAEQLRKAADDIEFISNRSKQAYLANVTITEEELDALLSSEKLISPSDAVEWGFATSFEKFEESGKASQDARAALFAMLMGIAKAEADDPDDDDPDEGGDPESDPDPDEGEEATNEDAKEEGESEKANEAAQLMAAFFMSMKN